MDKCPAHGHIIPGSMEKLLKNLEKSVIREIRETQSILLDEITKKTEILKVAKAEQVSNPFNLYKDCGFLGEGACGEVHQVYDKETNEYFAMKCIRLDNNNISPYLVREISIMYELEHENIVKLKKVLPYNNQLYLLMEFAGVDLFAFLRKPTQKVTIEVIKDWLRQLLSALNYLHKRGIIHRDLKPENIVIGSDLKLKITDFGSARRFNDGIMLTPQATALLFMAPEMLMGDRMYGAAVDMWAVGCIFFEMLEVNNPFGAEGGGSSVCSVLNEIFRKIGKPSKGSKLFSLPLCPKDEQGYPEVSGIVPSVLDVDGKDLLKKLLAVDPVDRITAEQALNHDYLKLKRDETIAAKSMGRHISPLHLGQPLRLGHNEMTGPSLDLLSGSSLTFQTLPLRRICVTDLDKSLMVYVSRNAMDELITLLQNCSPFWKRSSADGREVLDLEVYQRIFQRAAISPNVRIESSKDSSAVLNSCLGLVEMFMDANKWMKLFPDIVSMATTVEVISTGLMGSPNGLLQLMYEESQVLSPLVPTRKFSFLRFCQQIKQNSWAIVDVSYDSPHERHSNSQCRARRLPSGCFIEDTQNGRSKITWMEHVEIEDTRPIHNLYKKHIYSGLAFGAARRLATLQRTCERLNCQMNICKSSFDIGGVHKSRHGRRSLMKLSQKMVNIFCSSINTVNGQQVMISGMNDFEVCATLQKCTDPGHPNSMVLSAATSIWLPFSPQKVFDFIRDERSRPQWDVLSNHDPVQVGHTVSGYYPGNCISVLGAFNTNHNSMLILQESCIDSSGALVVYCPIDLPAMKTAMRSEDPSFIPILSLGFAILPDTGEKSGARKMSGGGSLVTVVLHKIVSNSTSGKLSQELMNTVKNLVGKTIQQIKAALNSSTC